MPFSTILISVLGLTLFEIVNSIDNAVINAEILKGMGERSRRFFLFWGVLVAILIVRGLLPWAIVWASLPSLGPIGAFGASFSGSPAVRTAVEAAAPALLAMGGTFLVLLFLHWLLAEPKHYGLKGERTLHGFAGWFFAVASLLLLTVAWYVRRHVPSLQLPLLIGSAVFFVTHGFKQSAEDEEKALATGADSGRSDLRKLIYLEIIDAVFSVDGVLGAFAFTLSVPLILLGNGIGALVVRQLTVGNIERITRYRYLKNGAMYSMLVLGVLMLSQSLGHGLPEWVSPLATFAIVGYFLWRSRRHAAPPGAMP